jgi:hypothetical protein
MNMEREITTERELHDAVRDLLDRRGIVYFHSRMDKRTTQQKGVPDFIFSVGIRWMFGVTAGVNAVPFAWECKIGKGKLSEDQEKMMARLIAPPNKWRVTVIRSVQDALEDLNLLGL